MRNPWDDLVELALAGQKDIFEHLLEELAKYNFFQPVGSLSGESKSVSQKLIELLADLEYTSYLVGAAGPIKEINASNYPLIKSWRGEYYQSLPHEGLLLGDYLWDGISFPSGFDTWRPVAASAVKALKSFNAMTRKQYDRLSQSAKSNAFTVTGLNSAAAVKYVRNSLAKGLYEGKGQTAWYDSLKKSPLSPSRYETIYRVAASKFWHRGQNDLMKNTSAGILFPYVNVITINDSRRSIACAQMANSGLNGTSIYRVDDPAYLANRTPRHYNCRCRDSLLTIWQAAEKGVREAQRWEKTKEPPNKPQFVPYFEVDKPPGWVAI